VPDKEHYTLVHAPIVEAILDIGVLLPENTDINVLDSIKEFDDYILDGHHFRGSGMFEYKSDEQKIISNASDPIIMGYRYKRKSQNTSFQFRRDGFNFNMLKPYTRWDDFKQQAQEKWNKYKEYFKPDKITRVALRFINKIPFGERFEPSDYFLTVPRLSPSLEKYDMNNLFCQITINNKDINAFSNITQGIEVLGKDKSNFIFDIDVFSLYNGEIDEDKLWSEFDNLRQFKNEIFFESVTEDTLDKFK